MRIQGMNWIQGVGAAPARVVFTRDAGSPMMPNDELQSMSVPGRIGKPVAGLKKCGAIGVGALWSVALVGVSLSGCAQQPVVRTASSRHGHEYFSEAKYGAASPRVVEDGQPVPRGGGQYLVGHPYTIAGHTYYPRENPNYSAVGLASWYGDAFHGRRTANGEVYDMRSLSAAHPTMPLPSYARVTNLSNGYSVIVRVNDRGPYHSGRVMDVSSRAADVLDFKGTGTARIRVDYVGAAPMEGSDDDELLASLRTDGSPASLKGSGSPSFWPIMVASQQSPPPPPVHLIAPTAPAPAQARRARAGGRHGRTQPRSPGPSSGPAGATVRSRRGSRVLRGRLGDSAVAPEVAGTPVFGRSRALFRDALESLAPRAGSLRPPPDQRRRPLARPRRAVVVDAVADRVGSACST